MENFNIYLEYINSDNGILYVIIRTVITYVYAVLLFRIGNRRFRLNTPMDFVLFIIIGAILGRTIYGGASLFSTMASSFILIFLHWLFAYFSYQNKYIGSWVKGKSIPLILNGEKIIINMKKNQITEEDLIEACHDKLHIKDLSLVKECYLERTGRISFIKKSSD